MIVWIAVHCAGTLAARTGRIRMSKILGNIGLLLKHTSRWILFCAYLAPLAFATLVVARSVSETAHIPPQAAIYVAMLIVATVQLLFVIIHEVGHAIVATALGWRVSMIICGPISAKLHPPRIMTGSPVRGSWRSGAAFLVPSAGPKSITDFVAVSFAGPLANIVTGLLMVGFAGWRISANIAHNPMEVLGCLSIYKGLFNLVPFGLRSGVRSDGGNILSYLRGADLEARAIIMQTVDAIIRGVRPRNWDRLLVTALREKSKVSRTGRESALLYSYYLDCGETTNARASLDRAIKGAGAADSLLISDAFLSAFMEKDFDRARTSLKMVKHKHLRQSSGYLTAEAALRAGEGDKPGAARCVWLARRALRRWPLATDLEREVLDKIDAEIRNVEMTKLSAGDSNSVRLDKSMAECAP